MKKPRLQTHLDCLFFYLLAGRQSNRTIRKPQNRAVHFFILVGCKWDSLLDKITNYELLSISFKDALAGFFYRGLGLESKDGLLKQSH